ncbi:MAG TPA: 1-deoxy-D-xylulose-5-phosphate reductoisomerase [Blastocatellia bacterium]|jgi:1-deoxy-D-xylulose-5-phosphate reductoisomerase|nr:1-deoxy-D-xylulose-5-phosphate reductoisomerase [Blastocatellia bacterium]
MKQIAILGSTGSIGCNTLRVVDALEGEFGVAALGAGSNVELLTRQIEQYRPRVVSVSDEESVGKLIYELKRLGVASRPEIGVGVEGLCEVATCDGVEIVIGAVVGARGLLPTYRALELGRRVALANKETLVVAGELMTRVAEKSGAELLPVDSEHNALHQCLRGERRGEVKRLILTASGGPFRNSPAEEIENATPAQALRHPTWRMGAKITVDSATMMNKGLEVIEARWLFNASADEIDIFVHPQSVVHSMIELVDGSIIAQLGVTDMRHAIQYALTYPERRPADLPPLDLTMLGKLEFFAPDPEKFPCIALAYDALRRGGAMPAVLNAANEVAVAAFLDEKIRFGDIPRLIRAACEAHTPQTVSSLDTVLTADRWARDWVEQKIAGQWTAANVK